MRCLVGLLDCLRALWDPQAPTEVVLEGSVGRFGAILGASWTVLEALLGCLAALLGFSEAVVDAINTKRICPK